MVKIWDVKLAKEIREKFEELWSEAKPLSVKAVAEIMPLLSIQDPHIPHAGLSALA